MFRTLASSAFLAMTSVAAAADFTLLTAKGYARFTTPDQWAVLSTFDDQQPTKNEIHDTFL